MTWPEDFAEWAKQAQPIATGVLLDRFADRSLVEDAIQVAFTKAAQDDEDRYFPTYNHFLKWVLKVSKNEILQAIRRQLPTEDSSSIAEQPRSSVNTVVWQCIHELDENDRQILTMYYYDNMTDGDIASVISLTAKQAWRRRHRALAHLRQLFLEHDVEPESWYIETVPIEPDIPSQGD